MSKKISILLSCGCYLEAGVQAPGNVLKCRYHDEFAEISAMYTSEWHAKCGLCRFGSWHGQARDSAISSATRHETRTDHPVTVAYLNLNKKYDPGSVTAQEFATLFELVPDEPPPF